MTWRFRECELCPRVHPLNSHYDVCDIANWMNIWKSIWEWKFSFSYAIWFVQYSIYEKKYYNFISNCCDTISIYGGNSQQRASNRQIIGNILLFNLEKRKLYVWKQSQFQMEIFNYGIVLWVVTADCWEMLCCKRVQINWCKILSWYRQASLLHRALHIFYSIA